MFGEETWTGTDHILLAINEAVGHAVAGKVCEIFLSPIYHDRVLKYWDGIPNTILSEGFLK